MKYLILIFGIAITNYSFAVDDGALEIEALYEVGTGERQIPTDTSLYLEIDTFYEDAIMLGVTNEITNVTIIDSIAVRGGNGCVIDRIFAEAVVTSGEFIGKTIFYLVRDGLSFKCDPD